MAYGAVEGEAAGHVIGVGGAVVVRQVTGITIRGRTSKNIVDVTRGTGNRSMRSG